MGILHVLNILTPSHKRYQINFYRYFNFDRMDKGKYISLTCLLYLSYEPFREQFEYFHTLQTFLDKPPHKKYIEIAGFVRKKKLGAVSLVAMSFYGIPKLFLNKHYRRAPHELFPKKGVPHQFPACLDILRKFTLAWRFVQFEEHLF